MKIQYISILLIGIILLYVQNNEGCTTINDCQQHPGQANKCLSSGKCLCNPGWTGDNGIYVDRSIPIYGIMLLADDCKTACNTVGQSLLCARRWRYCDGVSPVQQLEKDGIIPEQPSNCDIDCVQNKGGKCSAEIKGACECYYGWTGDDACYNQSLGPNKILAKNCVKACFYNHAFRNPSCGTV